MRSDSHNRRRAHLPAGLAPSVYVNRTLDLRRISAVGVDLDHTLVVYNDQAVNELAFAETCRFLIQSSGYPPSISSLHYDNSQIARGIVADVGSGNLLKLDSGDRVRRARRDDNFMSRSELDAKYGDRPVDVGNGQFSEIQSPFDLPAGRLFSLVLEPLTRAAGRDPDYSAVLDDIRRMLDRSHTRGDLKRHILLNPDRFVERTAGTAEMIRRFREAGTRTFLLTNSGFEYTSGVLDHVFGLESPPGGWRGLFDEVVVNADKPRFFDPADTNDEGESIESAPMAVWAGGCAAALERRLAVAGDAVFFVGDNPAADVVSAHRYGWRTGMVVPELDYVSPAGTQQKNAAGPWGDILDEGGQPTRFFRVLEEHADVYAARIESILRAAPDHRFKTP